MGGRKDVLPGKLAVRVRVFACQGAGEMDPANAGLFGAEGVVTVAKDFAEPVEQFFGFP